MGEWAMGIVLPHGEWAMGIVLSHGELGLGFVLPDEDRCGAKFFQTGTGETERSEDIFSFDSGTLPYCFSARGIYVQPLVYTDLLPPQVVSFSEVFAVTFLSLLLIDGEDLILKHDLSNAARLPGPPVYIQEGRLIGYCEGVQDFFS
jgi:hypothetical protein